MVVDGERYLVSGSKNTCHIWPAKGKFDTWMLRMFPKDEIPDTENEGRPHIAIGRAYSKWFQGLDEKQQTNFVDTLWSGNGGRCTLVGEVNRPWEEHVIAIHGKRVREIVRSRV